MSIRLRALGAIFLLCAVIMGLLRSLPITTSHLPTMDLAQTDFPLTSGSVSLSTANATQMPEEISEIRYGVWSACYYKINDTDFTCLPKALGYTITIQVTNTTQTTNITVMKAWTRLLVIQPLGTVVTFVAIPFSIAKCTNTVGMSFSIISFLVSLAALGIDIAFIHNLKDKMSTLGVASNTAIKPAFGMSLVAVGLVLLANLSLWGSIRVARGRRLKTAERLSKLASE